MDTSETYIKMCEKAEEIQEQKPEGSQGEFVYCEGEAYQEMDDRPLSSFIWLPRQDQLQEMVQHSKPISLVDNLSFFCFPIDRLGSMPHKRASEEAQKEEGYIASFTSMEQIWLAFVMERKYNKVWDGSDWISG